MTSLRVIPGQRVEHVIFEWRGYVQSVMSGRPRTVHVKTDNGQSEFVPESALKVLARTQANPDHQRKGLYA